MLSGSSAPAFPAELGLLCSRCRLPLPRQDPAECSGCGFWVRSRDGFWDSSAPQSATGYSAESRDHLECIERTHFWFPSRERLLLSILDRLSDHWETVVDLGCGTGKLLPALSRRAGTVVGIEVYSASLETAATRCPSACLIRCDARSVPLADGQVDLLLALDVLEHVDPLDLLGEARRLLKKDGRLLLTVPASRLLWSRSDELAGHRCRYDVAQLRAELVQSGFALVGYTHYQFLLFPAMLLTRRLLAGQAMGLERQPPRGLSRLLGLVNRLEVALLSRARLPFGSSLVAWAERAA